MHLVLHSRIDVAATWSDDEVARRWLRLFPKRRNKDGSPATPSKPEIDMIINDPDVLAERRSRLSDVSWWMRCTAENIARRGNSEDECTGRFWEGRYKVQVLLDESSLLACAAYVDGKGDYVLSLKGNQGLLHQAVATYIEEQIKNDFADIEVERCTEQLKGHGRTYEITYYQMPVPKDLANSSKMKFGHDSA